MNLKSKIFILCSLLHVFGIGSICSSNELIDALDLALSLPVEKKSDNKKTLKRAAAISYQGDFSTVSSWIAAFNSLPKNRQGANFTQHSGFSSCGQGFLKNYMPGLFGKKPAAASGAKDAQWQEFKSVLDAWLQMQVHGPLSVEVNWSEIKNNKIKPGIDFFDVTQACRFAPFAQKLIAESGDVFYLHGDLHGDIFSLLEEIKELKARGVINNSFRIVQDNVWFVFLGDYVDRGQYGCEVIYTMMRLALANPDRVIAVRGNHEDVIISSRYGFKDEVLAKFDDKDGSKYQYISRMNDFLPIVFYLGCKDDQDIVNYVQCCHGGVEEEYKPQTFLDDSATIYQLLPEFSQDHSKGGPFDFGKKPYGFMWNDFDVDHQDTDFQLVQGRGLMYGKVGTERVLQTLQSSAKSKIRGILRAHQHSGSIKDSMMKGLVESNGVYKLWKPFEKMQERHMDDGLVWTFNVGPDSVYGEGVGFDFDTYVELVPAKNYKNWIMKVFNTKIL